MEDYSLPPNSHKYKEEQRTSGEKREIKKVVKGPVKTRKKNGATKLAGAFISEDASSVKSYIFSDVLVPAVKKLIGDIVKDGIDIILNGSTSRSDRQSSVPYVSYSQHFNSGSRYQERYSSRVTSGFDYNDIVFGNRSEAEAVLDQMHDVIARYGFVTVADMYDMVDISAPYTSNKYGWKNLANAGTARVRDGWIIKLPKATPID